ncbi:MAG: tRNA-binding protein [Bacteroidia bacterium]|nr:tRNA-binding protein [Bacteroidia bacterium]MBT8286784.1 tRNA-binding protein [Bacteroidia bacterium]NNK72702.1 tRNA-binding protein [Flavobacteriaceae bacterium]
MSTEINFDDFTKVDLRVGTIIEANDFPEARKPSYKLVIDFGDLGKRQSSAQITTLYSREELIDKQVVAVVNFSPKQIANFMSECLILGAVQGDNVVLLKPENSIKNGTAVS